MKNGGLSKPWKEVSGLNGWQPSLFYTIPKSLLFLVVDKSAYVWQQESTFKAMVHICSL